MSTDITAPYSPQALQTVKQAHRQEFYAEAIINETPRRLVVSDGTLTFSEDYTPRISGSLTCGNNLDAAALEAIDPRGRALVNVYAGYTYPGGTDDVQQLAQLWLDVRGAQQPGDVLELTGNSAEIAAHECKWLLPAQVKSFVDLVRAIEWLLEYATAAPVQLMHELGTGYRADLVGAVALEPGLNMWEVAGGLATTAGLTLYCDSQGRWILEPPASGYGQTAAFLTPGPTSPVSKIDDVLSRQNYFDAAIITYKWKDANGDQEIRGTWAPPAATGQLAGAGCKTFETERPGPISQGNANEAARLAVVQLSTRGDSYVIEAAAHYWLRPGMTVQIQKADGGLVRHVVKVVQFKLGAGAMTVTTREPTNLGVA